MDFRGHSKDVAKSLKAGLARVADGKAHHPEVNRKNIEKCLHNPTANHVCPLIHFFKAWKRMCFNDIILDIIIGGQSLVGSYISYLHQG